MPATYNLDEIKKLTKAGHYVITNTAADTAQADFEMEQNDVISFIQTLNRQDFYKTMPSEKKPDLWQDVYKPTIRLGGQQIRAYVKIQVINDRFGNKAVIISFKRA